MTEEQVLINHIQEYLDSGMWQYEACYLNRSDLKVIIKALEQELILDKIRAEIEQAADKQFQIAMGIADLNERYTHIQMENAYRHSLNVIDKYKAESEERNEGNS